VIIVSLLRGLDQDGYTLGAVDYLIKPFQEEQLLESVRFVMSAQDPPQDGDLLVVDDDPDILELLARMLNFHGYQVRTAFNGWEALACVEESPPAAILLDLKMPRMDGYEVIQHLKQNRTTRFIPIIVITASPVDKERDRVRILGTGSSQYITKPLSIETLVKEIRASIEERQAP
jgi:DNA-binding response OmpR family regulator